MTPGMMQLKAFRSAARTSGRNALHVTSSSFSHNIHQLASHPASQAAQVPQLSMALGRRSLSPCAPKLQTARKASVSSESGAISLPTSSRLQTVLDGLDKLNSKDPRSVEIDGQPVPYELAYSRWLTAWVLQLCADGGLQPSEELHIAARGQHVERWRVPRSSYPEGRTAYLQWREDLKKRHAVTTTGLMAAAGYSIDSCKRVEQLILKRALREAEGQILEDGLCLVFLERQFAEFLPKLAEGAGGDTAEAEAKMIDILQKSWKKMGELGRAAALKLPLEPRLAELGGVYQYSIVKHFRRSGGQDGLVQLMNGALAITVNDSATNAVLASATIDQMWGFGIGQNTWSAEGHDLKPAEDVPAGVPKARSACLSFISIELHERQLPPGADPAAMAAAPPPETELPPLLPYSYVTPEFAETGNLVELVVTDISPLPQQLLTANDLAGGKLTVAAAVKLPGSGPTVVLHLPLVGGRVAGPAVRREQMTAEACTALQFHLEDGQPLDVEVASHPFMIPPSPPISGICSIRQWYVSAENLNDPAWEAYHAVAPAYSAFRALLAAGATSGSAEALPLSAFGTAEGAKSYMPPYTPPSGKSKPIEEAPAAGTCLWEKPPPPPPRSLLEMIPPRDLTPKPPPSTAADEFKAKVRVVARALAEEYKALLPPPGSAGDGGSEGGGGGAAEARHKALVFELNRSGKYAQMRDSLKASVVALVREKYRKSGSMSPNEMALLYNDLYGTLLAATHSALNEMIDAAAVRPRAPLPEPVPDKQRLGQLLELASQAEAVGDISRAEALHQRRLLAKNDAQVWYEYGTYCLRRGARGRAEQSFRESLSLDPTHRPALLALLGCSVAEGRATDPAYLEAAEAAAHRLMEVSGQPTLEHWAAMALVYKAYGDAKRNELSSCEQEMTRLEREAVVAAGAPARAPGLAARGTGGGEVPEDPAAGEEVPGELQARAFISLATSLLKTLSLPSEALLALELAAGLRHWPAAARETHREARLVSALAETALAQQGSQGSQVASQVAEALLAPGGPLIQLMRDGGVTGWRTKLLTAQLYRTKGALDEAIRFYQLAGCYTARGQHRYAANVFLLGAAAAPGLTVLWRGDLYSADMCLSEANVLDPEDPRAWGWLALVALKDGREEDAEKALSFGLRCGLDDAGVLMQIAEQYRVAGQLREQQRVLQELAHRLQPQSCALRLALARCLEAQHMGPEAAREVAAARELAAGEEELAAVAAMEEMLRGAGVARLPSTYGRSRMVTYGDIGPTSPCDRWIGRMGSP
ncbi:hypothetical protein VOLCADRAFT_104635 [Volvox carteri f. nagariensis]|uniref:Uncharacterized protein n=1 Tax=Volvox carteri f. nagariensis TaxID=3068 RepID=D8TVH0_VOLCA|nr:uncharacterized protein VOLCADRAFT_104635 [Volvox carteri f. nagariensis]EFJ48577.1 hypothetical protein VOLCADRAFT_104635 [Volvox carteri f. nagariensis]|eukprot:XP_002950376.1 hypothetical protein VOLCADRAFT_104635 [Volvox carteri f. nagariensis]